jgi:hypothetical protein
MRPSRAERRCLKRMVCDLRLMRDLAVRAAVLATEGENESPGGDSRSHADV